MVIAFESKELRLVCENQALANDKYGSALTNKLHDRLADLMAANTIYDVLLGNPKQLVIGSIQGYRIELYKPFVMTLVVNHVEPPVNKANQIDWGRIFKVKIISIEKLNA